jgi:hypothetical protein
VPHDLANSINVSLINYYDGCQNRGLPDFFDPNNSGLVARFVISILKHLHNIPSNI